ncbi:MAG TPA: CDP-diacylglycerol diphosphatase [Acetobacteraceae bacterium]|nr:CDP-diacylglycerol diphosphatase [Acetobacteraceae bacterium]
MHRHARVPLIGVVPSVARHNACRVLASGRAFALVLAAASFVPFLHTPARAQTTEPPQAAACPLEPKPNTLWSLAQCCAPNPSTSNECLYVDRGKGKFFIVKDTDKAKTNAYLIIPTDKVTGVDAPQIFNDPVVNFWDYGWKESQYYLKKPKNLSTGLAINSESVRDQNQLHIHISCVNPLVAKALADNDPNIAKATEANPFKLQLGTHNNIYEAVKVKSLTGDNSPFNVVRQFPHVQGDMKDQSIAVVESKIASGYYVLDNYYEAGIKHSGDAEELLDQNCPTK